MSNPNDLVQPSVRSPARVGLLIGDVARLIRKRFEQRARGLGLSLAQWRTIAQLADNEGIHQSALAELLEIEPMTLVRLLDKLADRGLLERRQHPTDRRTWSLFLQEEARPLLEAMQPISVHTLADAFAGISEADREQLICTLLHMKTNLIKANAVQPVSEEVTHG